MPLSNRKVERTQDTGSAGGSAQSHRLTVCAFLPGKTMQAVEVMPVRESSGISRLKVRKNTQPEGRIEENI
jgi:hypothetical protein